MKKLLIVDDSSTMRKIIVRALRDTGIPLESMLQADSATEALEQIANDPGIDLMLCDINMPQVDGLFLIREVRKDHGPDEMPIIVVTTEGREEVREQAMDGGANGYVHKPFTEEAIRDALAPYLHSDR